MASRYFWLALSMALSTSCEKESSQQSVSKTSSTSSVAPQKRMPNWVDADVMSMVPPDATYLVGIDYEAARKSPLWDKLKLFTPMLSEANCGTVANNDNIKRLIIVGNSDAGLKQKIEFIRGFDNDKYAECLRDNGYTFNGKVATAGKDSAYPVRGKAVTFMDKNWVAVANEEKWLPVKGSKITDIGRFLEKRTPPKDAMAFGALLRPSKDIGTVVFHGQFSDKIAGDITIEATSEQAAKDMYQEIEQSAKSGMPPFDHIGDEFTYEYKKPDTLILKLDVSKQNLDKMFPGM